MKEGVYQQQHDDEIYVFIQGTKRVSVSAITVGPSQDIHSGSLLHDQIRVIVSAVVKGKEREYDWIAKIHRSENESANYARFQVQIIIQDSHQEKQEPKNVSGREQVYYALFQQTGIISL